MRLYLRLLHYVRPYRGAFACAIVAMVMIALTEPAIPALLKPILDGSFVEGDVDSVGPLALLLVALFVIRGIATFGAAYFIGRVGTAVVRDLRMAVFEALNTAPLSYLDGRPTGGLVSKITFDATLVAQAATKALTTLVRDTLSLLGLLTWMFWLNWQLALIAMVSGPVIGMLAAVLGARLRRIGKRMQHSMGDLTHVTEETLRGAKVIRVFGAQGRERRRFGQTINRVRNMQLRQVVANSIGAPVSQVLISCALATILYLAAHESAAGNLTVGGFVSFFGAMALLFSPITRLMTINGDVQRGLAAATSLFEVIDLVPEPNKGSQRIGRARGDIHFENVSFRYENSEARALNGVDLVIAAGENVALVGPSGSGKTTLAGLVARLYNPEAGRVRLDDTDIASLDIVNLREQVALVSQDIVLFDDTVSANISFGTTETVDQVRVREAAVRAFADEFIERLPGAYEATIGQQGGRLSGGQRQRLAIARAFYKDAPILILDEATSALDTRAERNVQEALASLSHGRTTLTIAHRLSTVEKADRIVVLDAGRIIASGTHTSLLAGCPLYQRLYALADASDDDA